MKSLKYSFLLLVLLLINSFIFAQDELLDSKELRKKKEFRSFEEAMIEPEKVYRLRVTSNSPIEFPEEFEKLVNLQSLTFGNSKSMSEFTKMPSSMRKLQKLQA